MRFEAANLKTGALIHLCLQTCFWRAVIELENGRASRIATGALSFWKKRESAGLLTRLTLTGVVRQ